MKIHNRFFNFAALLAGVLMLSSCSETQLASHWAKQVTWPGQQEAHSTYKIGEPYKVGTVWYYPQENFNLVETGIASWYGPGFHADHTANGEVFDQNELTAAHRTLQMPCLARVTNLENGHSVVVRVNDRGPFLHGRIMDVSMRAAELLGFTNKGTARVRLEVLPKESRILAEAAKRGEDTTRMTLADLQQTGAPVAATPAVASVPAVTAPQPVKVASAAGEDAMPESLRTPTITVEELTAPGTHAASPGAPKAATYKPPVYQPPAPSPVQHDMVEGHLNQGKFMPDPVVDKEPVHPTGLFVQAGSFSVFENAERLTKRLASIAPTTIEPVTVNGKKLYRVKLGPISSVSQADSVLDKVIGVMGSGAKVIKD
jgi:rare lipoprotein A